MWQTWLMGLIELLGGSSQPSVHAFVHVVGRFTVSAWGTTRLRAHLITYNAEILNRRDSYRLQAVSKPTVLTIVITSLAWGLITEVVLQTLFRDRLQGAKHHGPNGTHNVRLVAIDNERRTMEICQVAPKPVCKDDRIGVCFYCPICQRVSFNPFDCLPNIHEQSRVSSCAIYTLRNRGGVEVPSSHSP
eukprot:CAMPEP_0172787142 /NCGR_PEP_ID=MMETSP1074-20121228/206302_1 /TAXON_ID=2916 /ORGANISM="Ceratium fusus, Strain PA161109" /LENGTH=188 /DNA_ID=CAMNT_0013624163 /DNA_START=35 /DNA_END=602 /DNA_ORIENTATION=+